MNPFDYFDKIYVINLDSRPDRLEQAIGEFAKAGIQDRVERFPAIAIPENPSRGNHLSHAMCIENAKEAGARNCLIFEDDIEWLEDPLLLKRVIPELNNWDLLYLGVNTERECRQVDYHLVKLTFAYSTHAYAINSNMFDLLIDINRDESTVHNDVSYTQKVIPYYNCYATYPLLAGQRKSYSDIMKREMDSNEVFKSRFSGNLIRRVFNVEEPTFVTFITPTLGRRTLERTVKSVINQTDWNWKQIVMFDGIDPMMESDNSHVSFMSCEKKGHAGLVRNEALKYVSTDWVAFVDDDDWIEPDYITALKRHINNDPSLDLVIFTYRDVTNGNTQPPINFKVLEFGHVGISFAIRTDFLIKNNIEFRDKPCEDWIMIEECLNKGVKFKITGEIKYLVGGRGQWR